MHENPNPDVLTTVSDKLKWYRIHNGYLQCDVAKAVGIDRTTYSRYEDNILDAYPLDKLNKIANLFKIDITLLLDNYNLFLYNGQGKQIKGLRKSMKLTQSEFAKYVDVSLTTIKKWEWNKAYMKKTTFKKLFGLSNVKSDGSQVL